MCKVQIFVNKIYLNFLPNECNIFFVYLISLLMSCIVQKILVEINASLIRYATIIMYYVMTNVCFLFYSIFIVISFKHDCYPCYPYMYRIGRFKTHNNVRLWFINISEELWMSVFNCRNDLALLKSEYEVEQFLNSPLNMNMSFIDLNEWSWQEVINTNT